MDNYPPIGNGLTDLSDGANSTILKIARIAKGRCTSCQADLSRIIAAIKTGKARIPTNCPHCRATFVKGQITEIVTTFSCSSCKTVLPDGGAQENVYCRHCGVVLDWNDIQTKRG